jgi:hypothetical protein
MWMYLNIKKQVMTEKKRLERKNISSQTGNCLPPHRNYSSCYIYEAIHMNTVVSRLIKRKI